MNGKERQFLRDFVSASDQTSGGRLARWLQPDSVVDTSKSELIFPMLQPSSNESQRLSNSPESPSSAFPGDRGMNNVLFVRSVLFSTVKSGQVRH